MSTKVVKLRANLNGTCNKDSYSAVFVVHVCGAMLGCGSASTPAALYLKKLKHLKVMCMRSARAKNKQIMRNLMVKVST